MPPQDFNRNAVLRDLADHNDFFDELVDSIPAKLYVAGNTGASLQLLCEELVPMYCAAELTV